MKGTFFSADFIKDNSENLRLLELNTDTAILSEESAKINWSEFINVISSSNIDTVEVIYKPYFHDSFVDNFSASLAVSASFVTDFNIHPEDINTVYPSAVTDADNKFILRLAYDEAAIFDSTYCKGRLNTYKLFTDDSSGEYITQFYHSSSANGVINTLSNTINPSNIPDVSMKDIDETFNPIDFHKIGSSSLSDADRWNGFIEANKAEDKLIEQFHYHSSSLVEGRLSSYRSFFILYGSDLDLLNIHSYKNTAIFDIPSDISAEVDDTSFSNKLEDYHYYEYTTNTFKIDGAGLLSTNKIQMADDSYKAFADVEVGERIKSYFISGSPQVENDYDTLEWEITGSSYPSGSYITESAVVFKNVEDLHYNALVEYVVDGDSAFSGTAKQFLVYNTGSDSTKFKHATELDPDTDFFFKLDGTLVDLDEVNYYVTSDTNIQIVELDVEDTDTYIISGSTAFNSVVSHNSPCFVEGTLIKTADGRNVTIEDIIIGDEVLTYNFKKQQQEARVVRGVTKKTVSSVVKYTFEDGSSFKCTHDHPLYSPTYGWISRDPDFTSQKYQLTTALATIGTDIANVDGTTTSISNIESVDESAVVYNLKNVEVNHNYYADNKLVHNRCFIAGTEITLASGDVKNIEDISVGEEVLTYNEETKVNELGVVGDLKQHTVQGVVELELGSIKITCTPEHPFFANSEWKAAKDLEVGNICRSVDGLEVAVTSKVNNAEKEVEVFNLLSVSDNHNFFANGILVHNK